MPAGWLAKSPCPLSQLKVYVEGSTTPNPPIIHNTDIAMGSIIIMRQTTYISYLIMSQSKIWDHSWDLLNRTAWAVL